MAELLLDIGNTRAKAALHQAGELSALDLTQTIPVEVSAVVYASVAAPERVQTLMNDLGLSEVPWSQIGSELYKNGLRNSYPKPELLGVDRWLAMLGARKFHKNQQLIVIDAGTAVTVDVVDPEGQHQGGWILAGLRLQQQAVTLHTAKVFNRDEQRPELTFGQDTVSCLQNGALAAVIAVIRYAQSINPSGKLVLTGGDAPALMPYLTDIALDYQPLLVFHGLSQYIDKKTSALASI